jgi:iron complex outermembrane receptor protein
MNLKKKWLGHASATLLSGTAMLVSHGVLAQQVAANTAQEAKANAESSDTVVVSARRRSERLLDVPVAATAVGEKELRQYDLTSAQNIKIVVPQITLDRGFTGSGASISMRGVNSTSIDAGVEQSVLIDYDGMAISRGRVLNDALFDLDSISVLKGPQALFFGKNSPGGVVSMKSANPSKTLEGFLRAGYETTSAQNQWEAAISGPISERVGFRIATLSSDSKGYIYNNDIGGVEDKSRSAASGSTFVPAAQSRLGGETKRAARFTLKYDDGTFDVTGKLLLSRFESTGQQSLGEVMGCKPGQTSPTTIGATGAISDPLGDCVLNNRVSIGWINPTILKTWPQVMANNGGNPYGKNDTVMPILSMNYKLDKITLTSVTGYNDYDYVSQGNSDNTAYSYFWSYSNEKNKSLYQELRAITNFDGPVNYAFGGHFENNDRTIWVGGANGPAPQDPATGKWNVHDNRQHNKSNAYSVFGQVTAKLSQQIELAGGARYNSEKKDLDSRNEFINSALPAGTKAAYLPMGQVITGSKSENNLSPEATLSWHPSTDVMTYAAYKTGYLAGGFSNPGTLSASAADVNTLSFGAEKVKGVELGLKASLLNRTLTASATLFDYTYSGLPLTSLIALSGGSTTYVTQNAATTVSRGLELEATYRPVRGLSFKGSASYNDSHFEDFNNAQCYTGQSVGQGCYKEASGKFVQNLSGKEVSRAPKKIFTLGTTYDFRPSEGLRASVNADARRSDGFYAGLNLNPLSYQAAFTTFNAGVKLGSADEKWSVALIGRNLTNQHYATLALDKPAGNGEVFTVSGEPRMVTLQFETRF